MKQLYTNQSTLRIAGLHTSPKNWAVDNVQLSSICFSGRNEGGLYQLIIPWKVKHKI